MCGRASFDTRGNANLREQAVNAQLQARGMRADQATNGLAMGEEDQGGHALDAHLHRRLQVLVGIHAGETQFADVGLAQLLEDRGQRAAGRAPGGREIDDHRQRRLQDLLGKILVGDGQYSIISIHCLYSFLSVEPNGYSSGRYACYRLQWKYTCSS
jgi:hypothetical protein